MRFTSKPLQNHSSFVPKRFIRKRARSRARPEPQDRPGALEGLLLQFPDQVLHPGQVGVHADVTRLLGHQAARRTSQPSDRPQEPPSPVLVHENQNQQADAALKNQNSGPERGKVDRGAWNQRVLDPEGPGPARSYMTAGLEHLWSVE